MRLEVLATGSSGNCYLLKTSDGVLIIEAGIKWPNVLKALEFNISQVIGCIISHEHGDHAKYAKEYQKAGIKIYTSKGTAEATGIKPYSYISNKSMVKIKDIVVRAFDTEHDAAEPLGFLIEDTNTKERLLFATDTYYVKYKFKNINYIMVECNYANDMLMENIEKELIHPTMANRLLTSHFELGRVKEFIKSNDNQELSNIILIHLSTKNSNALRFKKEIQANTLANVNVAKKGLKIDLRKGYENEI